MTRYDWNPDCMSEAPDGDWVRFEDVPQWQPIETAPAKTWVLIGWANHAAWQPKSARRVNGQWSDEDDAIYATPTHWMPLPPAPTPPRGETP